MMGITGEGWVASLASLMFFFSMFRQWCPDVLSDRLEYYMERFLEYFSPYLQISFHEFTGYFIQRNEVYRAIEMYLSSHSSNMAKKVKADFVNDSKSLIFSMDDWVEITDTYQGVQLWWETRKSSKNQTVSLYPSDADDKRYFRLTYHRRHRNLVTEKYLAYIMEEGKRIEMEKRQRKLYTNTSSDKWNECGKSSMWKHVEFKHPATFDTLAMDPEKKKEITEDLMTFRVGKDYYAKVGKAWKRGYLLYGPPGTGKSTMIAAIANLLEYDIYDLELTAVANNTELRMLLIETSSKSIIVIEDIDCSLDLTGKRTKKEEEDENDEKDLIKKKIIEKEENDDDNKDSKVTLSGLLNFIDGLWSSCGEERLIVFTTNHVDKLDPALIRRGRMDMHIELSYCTFEGFKVLAKNYLDIESHKLFETIRELLQETYMSPADVAENLMPKAIPCDAGACLENLVKALTNAKEKISSKSDEEEKNGKSNKEEKKSKKEFRNMKKLGCTMWKRLCTTLSC